MQNCLHYSGVSGDCSQCLDEFFLKNSKPVLRELIEGACSPRVNSQDIKNCDQVSLAADTCAKCVEGYKLTQADSLCVNHINNCVEYQVTAANADGNHDYVCKKCLEKFYLDSAGNAGLGECKLGTVAHCREFAIDKDECAKCDFGYYNTAPTTCEASDLKNISPNCLETDSTKPDSCLQCKPNYVLLQREEECELADKFKNILSEEQSRCIRWANATSCTDCEPMFYGTTCQHKTG